MRKAWWFVLLFTVASMSGVREAPAGPLDEAPADPCSTATSCAACTPRAGCGWCGETARCLTVNASCSGPAEGACGVGWACRATDCPGATTCRPCRTDQDCNGASCIARDCDGTRACVRPGSGFQCPSIDGIQCPAISMWHACTNDSQCGPQMRCVEAYAGQRQRRCQRTCYRHRDCPPTPRDADEGSHAIVTCSESSGTCQISCRGPGSCGAGMTCRIGSLDEFIYCL